MIFVVALVGADYYGLMRGPEIAQARQEVAAEQAAAQAQAAPAATAKNKSGAAPAPPSMNKVASSLGSRVSRTMLLKLADFNEQIAGVARLVLLAVALALAFVMKLPEEKPGEQRREALPKKTIQIITAVGAGVYLLAAYVVVTIQDFPLSFIKVGYPVAAGVVLVCGAAIGALWATLKAPAFGLTTERKKVENEHSINFPTKDGGWINITNPYQGTGVWGGAGAGKTYSIGEPMIDQFPVKNFAGLIYDFKFPVLAEAAQKAMVLAERARVKQKKRPERQGEKDVQLHIINFHDLTRSERVNPIRPQDMPMSDYALEYAKAIINNLNTASIKKPEFFDTSATAYLTGIIWFYKKYHPELCTIPHVIATAIGKDYKSVLSMLDTDLEAGDKARSVITAVQENAEKQVAAVVSTLQNLLSQINSPHTVWTLTPDEKNGEGFSLNLNDPDDPKLLVLGSNPTLKKTFSPIISCIVTVVIKLMNQQNKHRSYVFLDEAATLYVPDLEDLPNTGRSNFIATVYMTQDLAQMTDAYGKDKMNVLIASLGNQLYGKVNSLETAKHISEMVGREEKLMTSVSAGSSGGATGRSSSNQSLSYQERFVVRPQDTITLKLGEFIGQTVGSEKTFFKGVITRPGATSERFPLHPMVNFGGSGAEAEANLAAAVEANFLKVRKQVQDVLKLYPNTLAGATK